MWVFFNDVFLYRDCLGTTKKTVRDYLPEHPKYLIIDELNWEYSTKPTKLQIFSNNQKEKGHLASIFLFSVMFLFF